VTKPVFSHSTASAGLVTSDEAKGSVVAFMGFARQQIGVPLPIGVQKRGAIAKNFKREMEAQGWSLDDLVGTVRWLKREGYHPATLWAIFRFVDQARRDSIDIRGDLQAKVAVALQRESDPVWIRRLSLAQGQALVAVYRNWLKERSSEL
jgi:hypothetical protein